MSPNDFRGQWQKNIFRPLGLENEIGLIRAPTQVERLIISPPGSAIPDLMLPEQLAALGRVRVSGPVPGVKFGCLAAGFQGEALKMKRR